MGAIETFRDALFGNPPSPVTEPSREGALAAFVELSENFETRAEGLEQLLTASGFADTIYETVSDGIASTSSGDLFLVKGNGDPEFAHLWKNNSGVAQDMGVSLPSASVITATEVRMDGLEIELATIKTGQEYAEFVSASHPSIGDNFDSSGLGGTGFYGFAVGLTDGIDYASNTSAYGISTRVQPGAGATKYRSRIYERVNTDPKIDFPPGLGTADVVVQTIQRSLSDAGLTVGTFGTLEMRGVPFLRKAGHTYLVLVEALNASDVVVRTGFAEATDGGFPPNGRGFYRGTSNVTAFSTASAGTAYAMSMLSEAGRDITAANWLGYDAVKGDVAGVLGDSLSTEAYGWVRKALEAVGCVVTNTAVAGTNIAGATGDATAMCNAARYNQIPSGSKVVTINGGTNDHANNVPLGAAGSSTQTEFNGALNKLIPAMQARCPTARIILIAPPYGEWSTPATRPAGITADGVTNNIGLTIKDYADAMEAAGARWGVEVVNLYQRSGIHHANVASYMLAEGGVTNPGGYIHPDDLGRQRWYERLLAVLHVARPMAFS